jgi:hypothetical protein
MKRIARDAPQIVASGTSLVWRLGLALTAYNKSQSVLRWGGAFYMIFKLSSYKVYLSLPIEPATMWHIPS